MNSFNFRLKKYAFPFDATMSGMVFGLKCFISITNVVTFFVVVVVGFLHLFQNKSSETELVNGIIIKYKQSSFKHV